MFGFFQAEENVSGQEYVFGSSNPGSATPAQLRSAANSMVRSTQGRENAHIWIGSNLIADVPGGKSLGFALDADAQTAASQGVVDEVSYVEAEYKRDKTALLVGTPAVQEVGSYLVPTLPFPQVTKTIAQHFNRLPVRAFIVQRIDAAGSQVLRVVAFPEVDSADDLQALGAAIPSLLLHLGFSTQMSFGLEYLAPLKASS